jgi:organic radical activating enzyme
MTKNTFCILPFIHMQVKPSGQMKPCCRFEFHNAEYKGPTGEYVFNPHNLNEQATLSSSQRSDTWEDIRQQLLKNQPVAGCSKCYHEEETSGFSMRTSENQLRNDNNQSAPNYDVSKPVIKYLEMTFGNYCNLKCRTCNGDLSSTWWEDENALVDSGKYPDRFFYIRNSTKNVNIPFKWMPEDFANVEEIKFTGGEPMIHPDFIKLMDMLIEIDVAKNIKLDVFTNCSWTPGEKYISRIKQFKKVVLSLSVDGVGAVNDYIRSPSKWETVDRAVSEWLELENTDREKFHVVWNPTINIYNVPSIKDMINWWLDKNAAIDENWMALTVLTNSKLNDNEVVPSGKVKFNVLQDPAYMSVRMLKPIDWSIREKIIVEMMTVIRDLEEADKKMQKFLLKHSITESYQSAESIRNLVLAGVDNSIVSLDVQDQVRQHLVEHFENEAHLNDIVNNAIDATEFSEHKFISEIKIKFKKVVDHAKAGGGTLSDVRKFMQYTNDLDKLRDENFAQVFPELAEAVTKTLAEAQTKND